jgi:hypothetical protein
MKRNTIGLKGGFILGVLGCLFVLTIIFFTKTIYAESKQNGQPTGNNGNSGVTMGEIPLDYGELKAVHGDASKGVYFLWFVDAKGTIRVVGVSKGTVTSGVTNITRN